MRIAYLILAHNTPRHLPRLITALSSSSSSFYVHLDKKSRAADFSVVAGNNIHFTRKRVPVYWADFSQVDAILILIRAALADPCGIDRLVLLSGADYPLRSVPRIEEFFASNPDREFIDLVPMPCEAIGKPISRLTTYKVRPARIALLTLMKRALRRLGALPRSRNYKAYLGELAPYAGSEWWALSRKACEFIVDFARQHEPLVKFFKNTICPDESFFHTILGNSQFRPRAVRSLTYADWGAGASHPAYICDKHLHYLAATSTFAADDVLGAGEMLFARKFPDQSEALIAKLKQLTADYTRSTS